MAQQICRTKFRCLEDYTKAKYNPPVVNDQSETALACIPPIINPIVTDQPETAPV